MDLDRTTLRGNLVERVLERLGFSAAPAADPAGLADVYRAWCSAVPFDNVRKMIALRGQQAKLPGMDAAEFFASWLDDGTGGTCWPTSNALFELLSALGFAASRITSGMRDLGVVNHASTRVACGGEDYIVDSSVLGNAPLPLAGPVFVQDDPVFPVEIEAEGADHVVWFHTPPNSTHLPCRLFAKPVDHARYIEGYDASRSRSPFNDRLYARTNRPGRLLVLVGPTLLSRTRDGVETTELSRGQLPAALREEFGLSDAIVDAWIGAGALEASFAPPAGPRPPPVVAKPPSQR